jgi:hypothetical protein
MIHPAMGHILDRNRVDVLDECLRRIHAIEQWDTVDALIAGKVAVIRRVKPKEPSVIISAPASICISVRHQDGLVVHHLRLLPRRRVPRTLQALFIWSLDTRKVP